MLFEKFLDFYFLYFFYISSNTIRSKSWINLIKTSKFFIFLSPRYTQPTRNVPRIFTEYSQSVAVFWASRKHLGNILKENIFKKILDRKFAFVLKVYDLAITNVDLLANSSKSHSSTSRIFEQHSTFLFQNIPRISRNIVGLQMFSWSEKVLKNILWVILWNCQYWHSPLFKYVSELYWNRFISRVLFWKCS